tara:strand:+ start:1658 stop:2533 length:876 start_codon:yes stop_codon:yes gene_type:complete
LVCLLFLAGCQTTSNPWAGFPPVFKSPAFNADRAEYLSDVARFKADPVGFLGSNDPGIPCEMSAEDRKAFVAAAFIRDLNRSDADYKAMLDSQNALDVPPVFDRATVRLLDGVCVNGRIEGEATVYSSFFGIWPAPLSGNKIFQTSEVELKETCTYDDNRRHGVCRRYEKQSLNYATLTDGGALHALDDRKPTELILFDYGAYAEGLESAPGVSFQTYDLGDGTEANVTRARLIQNGTSLRYETFIGGTSVKAYFRRLSDRKLHGPVYWQNFLSHCYEAGEEVKRKECKEP